MAPEHEARTRVLYDHESEDTGRRRRAVADWGVGEDIFDRMPSRRFTRAERRDAHSGTIVISRDEVEQPRAVRVEVGPGEEPWAEAPPRTEREDAEPYGDAAPRFERAEFEPRRESDEPAPRRVRAVESWLDVAPGSHRFAPESDADEPRRERVVESWLDAEPEPSREEPEAAEPSARLVAASVRPEPAPVRTVVVPSAADEPRERRTVLISGHPGGLPMARPARPPKTAIERVGTRPDRIVAYAVALGFLLVLIAVLTTGQ